MSDAKTRMVEIIKDQPDDSSYDEILRELAFKRMVDRGIQEENAGRTVSNEDAAKRIRSWQK